MSEWQAFDYNPFTGARQDFHFDEETGKCTIRTTLDSWQAMKDTNAESLNTSGGKRFGEGKIVARIPYHIYHAMFAQAQMSGDRAYVKRLLNDPDLRAFRTFGGTI